MIKIIGGALQETPDVEGQKILVSKAAHDAGVTSPAMLKGRSFGITTTGSSFHYMAHKIVDAKASPVPRLSTEAAAEGSTVIALLKSGQIDAWSIVPNIANALTKGPDVVEIGKIADYTIPPGHDGLHRLPTRRTSRIS
ncbi:MAG: hypothetical protein M9905_08265 [Rhizobiaceae bacterium]|nr:hypothetical protein [Rhizobiaceae bacterium]